MDQIGRLNYFFSPRTDLIPHLHLYYPYPVGNTTPAFYVPGFLNHALNFVNTWQP